MLLAPIKDAWTAHFIRKWVEEEFDSLARKPVRQRKTRGKQIIFLACFVFEDIGQVLLQERFNYLPEGYLKARYS